MSGAGYAAIAQSAGSIAGAIMQQIAAQKAQKEMFDQYREEQIRQKGYAESAGAALTGRLAQATAETAKQQMGTGAEARLAEFANVAKINLAPSRNLMMTPQDRAGFEVTSKNRAKLGSYSDWALAQAIQDIKTQQELNKLTSFAGGEAGVFPFRMYDAQHKYDWLANLGYAIQGSTGAGANIYNAWQQGQQGSPQTAPSYYEGDANVPSWTEGMA